MACYGSGESGELTVFHRPVIGSVPIIRGDLSTQAWCMGKLKAVWTPKGSLRRWRFCVRFEHNGKDYKAWCKLEQDGQEIAIRLPWKARPDYHISDHNRVHLEGDDSAHDRFLAALVTTMNHYWNPERMFGLPTCFLFVGAFRSGSGSVRRWEEVCNEQTLPTLAAWSMQDGKAPNLHTPKAQDLGDIVDALDSILAILDDDGGEVSDDD